MAVTTADLVPPVGSKAGLPMTLVWADDLTDAAGAGSGYALFDPSLWVSGHVLTPSVPTVVSGSNASYTHSSRLDFDDLQFLGLTMENVAPSLNFGTGWLEHGQAIQDSGAGRHTTAQKKMFTPATTATITEPGRHVEHPRRAHPSARPGNHTWNQPRHNTLKHGMPSYDLQLGSQVSTVAGGRVEAITHRSSVELPSNGVGATYGDRHDSAYLTSLWSAPVQDMTTPTGLFQNRNDDAKNFSAHWGLNTRPLQHVLASGVPLSAPDSLNTASNHSSATDGDSLNLPAETIQTILVKDIHTETGTATQTEHLFPLGRCDLGNHAVTDTCGLIGYEGIFTATAFVSVSRNANAPHIQAPPSSPLIPSTVWNEDGVGTYAALNIQVHSGLPLRRNGLSYTSNNAPLFKYGSDGAVVKGMTDALVTTGTRSDFKGTTHTSHANESRFHIGRTNHVLNSATYNDLSAEATEVAVGGTAHADVKSVSKSADGFILGDTHTSGAWTQTIALSQDFLKDRIPTKVRVVPVLVRTETVSVAAGSSHPSSSAIDFDKPVVDYHVLVSLAPSDRINVAATLTSDNVGSPTIRNAPASNRLTANMNLENEGCEIYHAIFRVNPATLERIWFTASDASVSAYGVKSTANEMPNTVMPRHNSSNGGWGLHQVTPFRPLANASWSQVPLLCAAIEAGGMYQRGGISHLWDADAYGGDLFVGADSIEAAHLNGALGKQVWADETGDLADPRGSELLVFKYDPQRDPFYSTKDTTVSDNPLRDQMVKATSTNYLTTKQTSSFNVNVASDGWSIHDWVFPQIELMRYLGREDKASAAHPRHSSNTTDAPILHPTLHCSSLRFMDDGRMLMAAIQRDHIKSSDELPSMEQPYPFNPDAGSGSGCPPGYYRSGNVCIPITGGDEPDSPGEHLDPITGELIPGDKPTPNNGDGEGHVGGGDSFGLVPSWSRIVANTSARSLILMWSDAKAVNGKAVGGRARFEAEKTRINGADYYTQAWTYNDTWWSGSRIAWWYSESGMRAIPITYGSYPEVRCSYANLPRCLPHLMTSGVTHGYPMLQPVDRVAIKNGSLRDETGVDAWAQDRYDFLRRTRFVPTTIGFADYGPAGNPHQELGWSGWSFPRYLYDPMGYGDNTLFFSDDPAAQFVATGAAITPVAQNQWSGFASSTQFGHFGGPAVMSHHGPLHYGLSSSHHPFKVDRIWKQVHGGVGYDVPLHLLAPGAVHVRARAGGRGSLDLEMETPFHRTDVQHLKGGSLFNSGFDLGGKDTPSSARTHLGQYYLRTNLWVDDARAQAGNALIGGLESTDKIRGPMVSGNGLEVFWSDHPTDHFHAGALPIMPGTDYDLKAIEEERYAPAILGRIHEMSDLDYVAVAEQLQSSVDVHVSSTTRPMWDSGSIVSARGTGYRDTTHSSRVSQKRGEMAGERVKAATSTDYDHGMGKGQRICRTPDGALHVFNIERSGQSGSGNRPTFVHYSKPKGSDLFWNRKAFKANPGSATYSGKDEVGPVVSTSEVLRGASFASDSKGTIHAAVCISDSSGHKVYYTRAERKLSSYNPHPVYEWDWSAFSPVEITGASDLRQPSIAVDSADRIHLACRLVATGGTNRSYIVYCTMLSTEDAFPAVGGNDPDSWPDNTVWSLVSKTVSSTVVVADNAAANTSHACINHDAPKVCLLSDDRPAVFFRGDSEAASGTLASGRSESAVYVNVGANDTGAHDPAGRFSFVSGRSIMALGAQELATNHVLYYDAIVDERDRAFIVGIKSDNGRSTFLTSFDAGATLADQYDATDGLGLTKALFIPKDANVRPDYEHITMTTNGMGQLHMILGFRLGGTNAAYSGKVFRDGSSEAAISPLQWSAKPSANAYEEPSTGTEWPSGGTFSTPQAGSIMHFMEVWMPTLEFSQNTSDPDEVIRSINVRWLSVPSLGYDSTTGWYPVGSAQSLNGQEDFTHEWPQLRYQRFNGYDAAELDLRWSTNELSWMSTPHGGSRVYFPYSGGTFDSVGEGGVAGEGTPGWG